MTRQLLLMPRELGPAGLAGLALLGLAALFAFLVLEPLRAENVSLEARVARAGRAAAAPADTAAHKVAEVYRFLEKKEEATDWLAKLHGIGAATGVQVKSASYRSQSTEGRIVRYELTLPLAGSYPQIRDFLKRAQRRERGDPSPCPVMRVLQADEGGARGVLVIGGGTVALVLIIVLIVILL